MRRSARSAREADKAKVGDLVFAAFSLIGGIAVALSTEGVAAIGLGTGAALVGAFIFAREALAAWQRAERP